MWAGSSAEPDRQGAKAILQPPRLPPALPRTRWPVTTRCDARQGLLLYDQGQPAAVARRHHALLSRLERRGLRAETIPPGRPLILPNRSTDTAEQVDKGHGRIEWRKLEVSAELADYLDWPGLSQVCRITRRRLLVETVTRALGHRKSPAPGLRRHLRRGRLPHALRRRTTDPRRVPQHRPHPHAQTKRQNHRGNRTLPGKHARNLLRFGKIEAPWQRLGDSRPSFWLNTILN